MALSERRSAKRAADATAEQNRATHRRNSRCHSATMLFVFLPGQLVLSWCPFLFLLFLCLRLDEVRAQSVGNQTSRAGGRAT